MVGIHSHKGLAVAGMRMGTGPAVGMRIDRMDTVGGTVAETAVVVVVVAVAAAVRVAAAVSDNSGLSLAWGTQGGTACGRAVVGFVTMALVEVETGRNHRRFG